MSLGAMRAYLLLFWVLLEQTMASAEILYVHGVQDESVNISCETKPGNAQPTEFYMFRKSSQQKDLLLSVTKTEYVRPEYKGRVRVSARPNSSAVNVTLLDLQRGDTGLYVCEFTTMADRSQLNPTEVILLVKDNGGNCLCVSHSSLIYAMAVAVVLLLFTLSCLSVAHYRKAHTVRAGTGPPIYEQMTKGTPAHRSQKDRLILTDPVYAVPMKAEHPDPDSPYAVPRKVTSRCDAPEQDANPDCVVEKD